MTGRAEGLRAVGQGGAPSRASRSSATRRRIVLVALALAALASCTGGRTPQAHKDGDGVPAAAPTPAPQPSPSPARSGEPPPKPALSKSPDSSMYVDLMPIWEPTHRLPYCQEQDLSIAFAADKDRFDESERVTATMTVKNVSSRSCLVVERGSDRGMEVFIYRGEAGEPGDRSEVWRHPMCSPPWLDGWSQKVLDPGVEHRAGIDWNQRRRTRSEECPNGSERLPPGTYTAVAMYTGIYDAQPRRTALIQVGDPPLLPIP